MDDGWIRPAVSEDFGDAVVACGAIGLIVGTALGNASFGVIGGLMLGVIADGFAVVRASHAGV